MPILNRKRIPQRRNITAAERKAYNMPVFFEGWYFKQQSGQNMIAFIPAFHTGWDKKRTGSVQIITPDASCYIELPGNEISISRRPFAVRAGNSVFSMKRLELNIQNDSVSVTGRLQYRDLTLPQTDIMGPYRFVPFMECRHSVFSLAHTVEGSLMVNGRLMEFTGGAGYMEGDRGRSFPKRYVWTQCSWFENGRAGSHPDSAPYALMLSAAEVKPLGKPFIGIIGFVYYKGREYRIATYKGAEVIAVGGGILSVRQGDYTLTAELLESRGQTPQAHTLQPQTLRAPASGEMIRLVKESLACRARYAFYEKDTVIFEFISETASFEYEFPN